MHIIPVFLAVIGCIITKPNQEIKVRENEEIKSIKQETKHFKKKINNAYEGLFEGLDYAKDIEEYDYFELLENEITPFMKWLETRFDLDNSEDVEFVDQNFNKLMVKAISEGVISDVFHKPTPLYTGMAHNQLMTDTLNLLNKDAKSNVYNFYNPYSEILHSASKAPDSDENHAGTHYYEYGSTQKDGYYTNSYITKDYSISARTRFEEHYFSAINLYKNDSISVAMDELGRAMHYVGDAACTPHSSNLRKSTDISKNEAHNYYENWVKLAYKNNPRYVAATAKEYYDKVLDLDNPGEILNDVVKVSAQFKDDIHTKRKDTTDVNYAPYVEATQVCIPYAQQIMAAIMNRFYEDVTNKERKINYIKDGSIYYIKNVGSGKYIDVKGWSSENDALTHPYSFHGGGNQQFRAEMQNDGSFKFTPMHALDKKLHISRVIDRMEHLNITGVGHKFKPIYYKNGMYKFVPEYDSVGNTPTPRYYKYPVAQVNAVNRLRITEVWDPTDKYYYWQFEESPIISNGDIEVYLGKGEVKRVQIIVSQRGEYDIETFGNVDTYFENLSYRSGNGNANLYSVITTPNDDGGENYNAKYSNVELLPDRVYLLTLRGLTANETGNIKISVTGKGPKSLQIEETIRTSKYEIDDSGRFKNPYDEINFNQLFNKNVEELKLEGYTKVAMIIEFYAYEINDGYQYFWVYNGNQDTSKNLYGKEFEHKPGSKDGTARKYIFNDIEFNLSDMITNRVYIRYGAAGSGEDNWVNYNLKVNIKIY